MHVDGHFSTVEADQFVAVGFAGMVSTRRRASIIRIAKCDWNAETLSVVFRICELGRLFRVSHQKEALFAAILPELVSKRHVTS